MNIVNQPDNTKLCGHCCLATILNITLQKAVDLIGHRKGTKTKELTKHFHHSKLVKGVPDVKALCIARPINKKAGGWHWVLHEDGFVYDPLLGAGISIKLFYQLNMRISSYIPVIDKE